MRKIVNHLQVLALFDEDSIRATQLRMSHSLMRGAEEKSILPFTRKPPMMENPSHPCQPPRHGRRRYATACDDCLNI
jgi:hypothetical protein